jgi:hypothetical protein
MATPPKAGLMTAKVHPLDLTDIVYTSGSPKEGFQSQFHYHVLDGGTGHVYIKPATPRLKGKVERSHWIDAEEFYRMLEGVVIDDTELFNDRLQEWGDFYNYNRPDGVSGVRLPMRGSARRPRARCERTPSVAQWCPRQESNLRHTVRKLPSS